MNNLISKSFGNNDVFNFYVYKSCYDFGPINIDSQMFRILEYLKAREFSYFRKNMPFDSAHRYNKYFFDKYLPLQNVNCLNNDYDVIEKISPLDIPIIFKKDFKSLGLVFPHFNGSEVFFENILLDTKLNGNIVSIYAHELVHTQVEKNLYELCENYFDREFLSIFVELVSSYYCSYIYNKDAINKRLRLLKHNIKMVMESADIESACYMISTLKAFHLYDVFLNSTEEVRKEILNFIEEIFKENNSIGAFSEKFDINFDNSKKLKYVAK